MKGAKSSNDELIDVIYESAIVPEKWPHVLDRLADLAGCMGTMLFASSVHSIQWIASEAIRGVTAEWTASPYALRNIRGERLVSRRDASFLTDLDGMTIEEIERDPFYTEFLRPRGWGWCVGTTIRAPNGDELVFSAERRLTDGPVPAEVVDHLNLFRPHLARSAVLAARIGLEKARARVETLALLGLPAAVLGSRLNVIAANELFAASPTVEIGARDRLRFLEARADGQLLSAFTQGMGKGRSIGLKPTTGGRPTVAHILPLAGSVRDIFNGAQALLYLTEASGSRAGSPEVLQALYDLSPTEARIAALITEGLRPSEIAARQGVQLNTVRVQLRSIYAKTGVHRQADLVRLLGIRSVT